MTEPTPAPAPDSPAAGSDAGASPGEQMARRLVQDVAAYEVDPPPPARAGDQAEALAADQAADGRGDDGVADPGGAPGGRAV